MVKSNRSPARENSGHLSADGQIALLIAAVTLGLLLRDVVTDLLPGDAGEFHFAAWRWGLAHPTGYPLYLLLGGVWQHLWAILGVSPALSLNALSAVFTAAAAGLFYLLLRRWLPGPVLAARLAAGLGVAVLVANPTLRTQSIQAEVYSLHLLLVVAILLAAARLAAPARRRAGYASGEGKVDEAGPARRRAGYASGEGEARGRAGYASGEGKMDEAGPARRRAGYASGEGDARRRAGYASGEGEARGRAGYAEDASPAHPLTRSPAHPLILLALLLGLSLAHHGTTLLLLPPLVVYLTLANRGWWRPLRTLLWAGAASLLPLLLYLYIPLRSGPDASPWYHQRLGDGVLTLYAGGWQAFVDFVTGRSISVGFYAPGEAWANLPVAGLLWLRHFEWPGLLLMALGLFVLVRLRNWPLLALTLGYAALHLAFNLFYAIGDIFVYYIPLYLIGCTWIAFGAAGIGLAFRFAPADPHVGVRATQLVGELADPHVGVRAAQMDGAASQESVHPLTRSPAHPATPGWSILLLLLLFWLPVQLWLQYSSLPAQLRAESSAARIMWEEILAAQPPDDAVLVSNDRNEIVPLFYLQTVEGRGVGMTGLFPLIAPDGRFADIGATVQTALGAGGGQPVYLIKPMAGLEARFTLAAATPPLVQVTGLAAAPPTCQGNAAYGPLRLLGYDVQRTGEQVKVTLHWQVLEPMAGDYTTTVQLFDAGGEKVAQDDRRPGGDFYPTSLWKPGEVLLDRHTLTLPTGVEPARLLVGMYSGPDAVLLAPPLEIDLSG